MPEFESLPVHLNDSFCLVLQDVAAYQLLGPTYNGAVVGEAHYQGLYNESHAGER